MKKSNLYVLCLAVCALIFTSCSDDNDPTNPSSDNDGEQFVIAATPTALEGVADYLLSVDKLSEGQVSLMGNGIEQDGSYRYYVTSNNTFISLLYGQGNPGAVTAYKLNNQGNLVKLTDFQSENMVAFNAVDDDVLMMQVPRDGSPMASWYKLDTESLTFTDQGQIDVFELANNGEQAYFNWLTQVGDYIFAPYMSLKMCCNDKWGTNYPNKGWVAVYSYPDMQLQTVIEDDRTSYIGRYFTSGLEVVENGDVYAFSSSIATSNDVFTSTKPSAITRINSGELNFDQSYFFDIEAASGGYYLTDKIYAGNGKFVLMMHSVAEKEKYPTVKKLAIVDVFSQSFTWVDGISEANKITNISTNNYVSKDKNTVYLGITTDKSSYVYSIDVASATATQGLEVIGGEITAISHLTAQ